MKSERWRHQSSPTRDDDCHKRPGTRNNAVWFPPFSQNVNTGKQTDTPKYVVSFTTCSCSRRECSTKSWKMEQCRTLPTVLVLCLATRSSTSREEDIFRCWCFLSSTFVIVCVFVPWTGLFASPVVVSSKPPGLARMPWKVHGTHEKREKLLARLKWDPLFGSTEGVDKSLHDSAVEYWRARRWPRASSTKITVQPSAACPSSFPRAGLYMRDEAAVVFFFFFFHFSLDLARLRSWNFEENSKDKEWFSCLCCSYVHHRDSPHRACSSRKSMIWRAVKSGAKCLHGVSRG